MEISEDEQAMLNTHHGCDFISMRLCAETEIMPRSIGNATTENQSKGTERYHLANRYDE